jgi:hypothetical protein
MLGLNNHPTGLFLAPQALVVYPPIEVFANALLAALRGLRLAAAGDSGSTFNLANAFNAPLANTFSTLIEAPRVEARGAVTGFAAVAAVMRS